MGCRGVGCGVREGVDGERGDRGERGGFGCGGDIAGGGDVGNVGGVGRHDGGDIGGGGDGIGGGGDGIGGGVGIGGALLCLLELRLITPSKQACARRPLHGAAVARVVVSSAAAAAAVTVAAGPTRFWPVDSPEAGVDCAGVGHWATVAVPRRPRSLSSSMWRVPPIDSLREQCPDSAASAAAFAAAAELRNRRRRFRER